MRSPPRYSGLLLLVSLFALGCRSTPIGPAWNAPLSFEAGEQIMAEAPANLMRGIEAVGGRLMITDQRLLFQPHSINIQGWQTEILFRDVTEVRPRRTLGLVPNGILIKTRNGGNYKFVVYDREHLIQIIRNQSE